MTKEWLNSHVLNNIDEQTPNTYGTCIRNHFRGGLLDAEHKIIEINMDGKKKENPLQQCPVK